MRQRDHVSSSNANKVATAPYNFVPLPRRVFIPRSAPGDQDTCNPELMTGYLECTLTTLTPLYTRNPERNNLQHNSYDFCTYSNTKECARPVIPGRSLRGLIRTVVEIMSFSRIHPVADTRPFYRTMDDNTTIGKVYLAHMQSPVYAGFIEIDAKKRYWIIPAPGFLRIHLEALPKSILAARPQGPSTKELESGWHTWQYHVCWVHQNALNLPVITKDNGAYVNFERCPDEKLWHEAVLVLTGPMGPKQHEFIVRRIPKQTEHTNPVNPKPIPIDDNLWEAFHSKDQIREWQKAAYGKKGVLQSKHPIFYRLNADDTLLFFGRPCMFRLPYEIGPLDLIDTSDPDVEHADLAESIFGYIPQGKGRQQGLRGRVRVEAAHLVGPVTANTFTEVRLKQLYFPRPSCYAHYLTQRTDDKSSLHTYLVTHQMETRIRGHKMYHHRILDDDERQRTLATGNSNLRIQCVSREQLFTFRVHFSNLTELELGALLCAINLPPDLAHKIGMGKPLGLGSVRMHADVYLIDADRRYGKTAVNVQAPAAFADLGVRQLDTLACACLQGQFIARMIKHAVNSREPLTDEGRRLAAKDELPKWRHIARFADLSAMLQYRDGKNYVPDAELTDYMSISKKAPIRYQDGRILPSPRAIGNPKPMP